MAGSRPTRGVDPEGEFPFDVPTYVFHLFVAIGRYRDARLDEALRPLSLSVSRHRALSVIAQLGPCTMKELAEFSAVDRTTMTRAVDQLVAAALVQRATPSTDRRQVVLTATSEGLAAFRDALKVIYRLNVRALDGVPEELQRTLARAQQAVLANLGTDSDQTERLMRFRRSD